MPDLKTAAYRLIGAARALRDIPATADARLRGILEEEMDSALRLTEQALNPGWDGSEPCRDCRGRGDFTESPRAGHVTITPCGLCSGTGRKGVLVFGVAS